ncbi:PREDICTED: RRP15-like protein [Fragaria vesca subsp. vesca]|uniref:RRP15-like protein n=1 Tax=Fragaria vesca subsp. vesca TaxID=101020 RepID=UPI0002C30FF2|nr:PREDICTED: RRP15-like protein [Fragaria vesca subsp. vesca]
MAEETQLAEAVRGPNKRRIGKSKGSKARKKSKKMPHASDGSRAMKPKKIDPKMKKLYRKRAREYDSDEEEEEEKEESGGSEEEEGGEGEEKEAKERREAENGFSDEEEDDEVLPGIMKLSEGCNAFRLAFKSIIKKSVADDVLGPIISGNKKLIAEKLAEAEAERKVKGEAKDKQLVIEKGHVVNPVNFDPHEKFLISLATRGVVTLFNAVSKAQHAQKGLDPSRFKDAKVIRKRRKEAFFSELGKTSASAKAQTSKGSVDNEGPAWAPLRDNFMLTNSKLKDWDKMPEQVGKDDIGRMSEDSSSEDD